mmetsp:Transcript_105235/g.303541  ORF Transcript_105235/g.303541 Transcript_105235/m.303541 type:complete len:202 (+) Transcript_105235:1913-2518(+)
MWTDFNNLIPSAQQELVELVEHEQEREHRYPSEDEEQILYQSVVAAAKMAAISKCTEVVALFATCAKGACVFFGTYIVGPLNWHHDRRARAVVGLDHIACADEVVRSARARVGERTWSHIRCPRAVAVIARSECHRLQPDPFLFTHHAVFVTRNANSGDRCVFFGTFYLVITTSAAIARTRALNGAVLRAVPLCTLDTLGE